MKTAKITLVFSYIHETLKKITFYAEIVTLNPKVDLHIFLTCFRLQPLLKTSITNPLFSSFQYRT